MSTVMFAVRRIGKRLRSSGMVQISLYLVIALGAFGCGRRDAVNPRTVDPVVGTWVPDWKTTEEQFAALPEGERSRSTTWLMDVDYWRQTDAFLWVGDDMVATVGIKGLRNNVPMFVESIGPRQYNITRKRGGMGDRFEVDAADRLRLVGELPLGGPTHLGHIDAYLFFSRKREGSQPR